MMEELRRKEDRKNFEGRKKKDVKLQEEGKRFN